MRTRRATTWTAVTLVELIVVTAILGLLVAVAMPKLSGGALTRSSLRQAASRVAGAAMEARTRAIATRRVHLLLLAPATGEYVVFPRPLPDEEPTEPTLKGELPEEMHFAAIQLAGREQPSVGPVTLRFGPDGWVDPALIQVADAAGNIHTVVIAAPCGRVETYAARMDWDERGMVISQ